MEGDDGCLFDGLPSNSRHSIRIRSRLPIPIAIYNASLPIEAMQHFTVRSNSSIHNYQSLICSYVYSLEVLDYLLERSPLSSFSNTIEKLP